MRGKSQIPLQPFSCAVTAHRHQFRDRVNVSSKRLQHDRLVVTAVAFGSLGGAQRRLTMDLASPLSKAGSFKRDSLRRLWSNDGSTPVEYNGSYWNAF